MTEPLRLGWHVLIPVLLFCWMMVIPGEAIGKVSGILTVKDVLTLPNRTARIEAHLSGRTSAGDPAWGGVPLELRIDGRTVETVKTDTAGLAAFEYTPKMRGIYVITVAVDATAAVAAEKTEATLCVWERRRPILLVEVEAVMQPTVSASTPSSVATGVLDPSVLPMPDAVEQLSLLTQYYYNVVYVPTGERSSSEEASAAHVRRWLESHKFPRGLVVIPPAGGLGATIEAFAEDGWTTMKEGIGRTRFFAETLLHHRMEVVVVTELPKGELPRKAKRAKEWAEVRKKL